MTNYLLYNYYYRYRQLRKNIKDIVDTENYVEARNQLESAIAEQSNFYPNIDIKKDFNYGEKLMMDHADRHLGAVIDQEDPEFIDSQTGQIKHQSDIVKDSLLYTPKQNYADT